MVKTEPIDIVFSLDCTGSMSPCIAQVRKEVTKLTEELFKEVDNLHIGIICHGDYCDRADPAILDLTNDKAKISKFVNANYSMFCGGDLSEQYEYILYLSRSMSWRAGKRKVLVMIGDNIPHPANYPGNTKKIDWRNELALLLESGVSVYGVQALGYREADAFYQEIAEKTQGFHLRLEQFNQLPNLIKAVCYQQSGKLNTYDFKDNSPSFGRIVDTLLKRKPKAPKKTKHKLEAVPNWRFQILEVDKDCSIQQFVESQGLVFKKGNGFYELTKTETIQDYKECILYDTETEEYYTGKKVRQILGLPESGTVKYKPNKDLAYRFFVQSTSNNRKLISGTNFLYEVDVTR